MLSHKHHIVPKHMGGSDDPSNLVVLSVEEHAEAHRLLWEKDGLKEDYLAWKALSGQLKNQEIWLEKSRLGGKALKGYKHSEEAKLNYKNSWTKERREENGKIISSLAKGVSKSDSHKNAMKGKRPHVNQTGEKNNNAKAVKTPYGIFGSAKDASRYFENANINIKYNTMMYKINTNKAGWSYLREGN
jgi:hypothetical protein